MIFVVFQCQLIISYLLQNIDSKMTQVVITKEEMEERTYIFDEVKDQFFLVRWLNLHTFIQMFRTMYKPLLTHDIFNLRREFYPQVVHQKYTHIKLENKDYTVGEIFFKKLFLVQFVWAGILAMVASGLAYAGPLVIKQIMQFISNKKATPADQQTAYNNAAIWVVLYTVKIFVNQYSLRLCYCMGQKAQQVLNLQVFNKLMKLSHAYRRHLQEGDLMTHYSTDVKFVFNFLKVSANLFSAPTTLILVQYFLYQEVGNLSFIVLAIVLISLSVQIIIDLKLAQLQLRKLTFFQQRVSANMEMFTNMKQIKSLGWGQLIINKNKILRAMQNKFNKTYFIINAAYQFIVNFSPVLGVFLIFITQIVIGGQSQLDVSKVYVLISYIGLIFGPLGSLPSTIVAAIDAAATLRRFNHLFGAEEIVFRKDQNMQHGEVRIDHMKASWQTQISNKHFKDDQKKYIQQQSNVEQHHLEEYQLESQVNLKRLTLRRAYLSKNYQIDVPFHIHINKGDRLIVLGQANSGKSSFLQCLLGHLSIFEGDCRYGGKIGYMPQRIWLKKQSIRSNIIFGQQYNAQLLQQAQNWSCLTGDLNKFANYDNMKIVDSHVISQSQKRKIALARVLYYKPDIYLLDDPFSELQSSTIDTIYNNFNKHLKNKTFIISTHLTTFLLPSDKVVIFQKGTAIEYGNFQTLVHNKDSTIHQYIETTNAKLKIKKKKKNKKNETILEQNQAMRSCIRNLTNKKYKNKLVNKNHQNEEPVERFYQNTPNQRVLGVPMQYYYLFFNSAPAWLYILFIFLIMLAVALKAYSSWWIGAINSLPWVINQHQSLIIYICLIFGYGITYFFSGLIIPFLGMYNTEFLGNKVCGHIQSCQLGWTQKQNKIFMTFILSRDNQEMYIINGYILTIISNVLIYLATLIMIGYNYPLFFILGAVVVIINIVILYAYHRAQRQLFMEGIQVLRDYHRIFENSILGVDTIRAFNKVDYHRILHIRQCYKYPAYQMSYRFIVHGMSILSNIMGISIIAGAAYFSISNKFAMPFANIALIGTSISLSNTLSSTITAIINDTANFEIQVKSSVRFPNTYPLLTGRQEPKFDTPEKPAGWPKQPTIQLKNVTYRHQQFSEPILKQISLVIKARQKVGLYEKEGASIQNLFLILNKIHRPTANADQSLGEVIIDGIDIKDIGRKYLSQDILLLNCIPFVFSGTLKQNLDPFNKHDDEKIYRILSKIDFWSDLQEQYQGSKVLKHQQKLSFMLQDGGANISHGSHQKINIARALLEKPKILMCDYVGSSFQDKVQEKIYNIIFEEFQDSTVLLVTSEIENYLRCDRVICFSKGQIKQDDIPQGLIIKDSEFSALFKRQDPQTYESIIKKYKK